MTLFYRLNKKISLIIEDKNCLHYLKRLHVQAESKLVKMDYNKLIKRRNTNHLLRKENAIIRNISDNKIFEAELIADKDLIPKETAVMKAYREKQQSTNPI